MGPKMMTPTSPSSLPRVELRKTACSICGGGEEQTCLSCLDCAPLCLPRTSLLSNILTTSLQTRRTILSHIPAFLTENIFSFGEVNSAWSGRVIKIDCKLLHGQILSLFHHSNSSFDFHFLHDVTSPSQWNLVVLIQFNSWKPRRAD